MAYDQAMRFLASITMLVLALAMVQPVSAQSFKPDFDAGWAAYVKNDYATTLRHFRPLAKKGHVDAQLYLGVMYRLGYAVTKDGKEAVRWFCKAAKHDVDDRGAFVDVFRVPGETGVSGRHRRLSTGTSRASKYGAECFGRCFDPTR